MANIYSQKQRWKFLLLIAALVIVVISLWYTNSLVEKIAKDERRKVELWAEAIQRKANLVKFTNELFRKIEDEERKRIELWALANKELTKNINDYTFVFAVISNNTTIPVIITDERGKIIMHRNLDTAKMKEPQYLDVELKRMKQQREPIELVYYAGLKNLLYYSDSRLFSELRTVFDGLIKSFITEVAINSASVPVIYTDSTQKNIIAFGNIDSVLIKNGAYVEERIAEMKKNNPPITIDIGQGWKNYIYYEDSFLLTQLKYYPFVQFGVIGLFLLIAYTLFSTARKAEQNQVWIGMAKETAHQIGTPLSSLMAWVEYFKTKNIDTEIITELEKDVKRLEIITERFSKIGATPKLEKTNIAAILNDSINYMRSRTSKNVTFTVNSNTKSTDLQAQINAPLFAWVIENLCRNAADAMNGNGSITVDIHDETQYVYIDVTDTGKGIPKNNYKAVFEPGFTTKQRGWGLGLSLSKRIIENYHSGKIFVKSSVINKGTTFRIVLNK